MHNDISVLPSMASSLHASDFFYKLLSVGPINSRAVDTMHMVHRKMLFSPSILYYVLTYANFLRLSVHYIITMQLHNQNYWARKYTMHNIIHIHLGKTQSLHIFQNAYVHTLYE